MPARKSKQVNQKVKFQGFVSLRLNAQEKKHVKANQLEPAQVFEFVHTAAFHGYKFSLSWSKEQDCYTATLYGNRWGAANAGYAMSIRHFDALIAITALSWVMDQNGWEADWSATFGDDGDLQW